jgi:hypothetical protein
LIAIIKPFLRLGDCFIHLPPRPPFQNLQPAAQAITRSHSRVLRAACCRFHSKHTFEASIKLHININHAIRASKPPQHRLQGQSPQKPGLKPHNLEGRAASCSAAFRGNSIVLHVSRSAFRKLTLIAVVTSPHVFIYFILRLGPEDHGLMPIPTAPMRSTSKSKPSTETFLVLLPLWRRQPYVRDPSKRYVCGFPF